MAEEIIFTYLHGKTCYSLVFDRNGNAWSTSGLGNFAAYSTPSYPAYALTATEQGTASAIYTANFPGAIVPGFYNIIARQQIGGSPAETDPTVAVGNLDWNGSNVAPLTDTATSGQVGLFLPVRLARGVAVSGFPFKLVSSADHVTNFTSGIVSGQISKDCGNFQALQSGNVSEIGYGWYTVSLTSGDLSCGAAALLFTANGVSGGQADQRDFSLLLQHVSGF